MACRFCAGVRQWILNGVLLLDKIGNWLLLGSPNETISRRTARARAAGERWAVWACATLTWIGNRLSGSTGDHCDFALDLDGSGSIGAEIWSWSPPEATKSGS